MLHNQTKVKEPEGLCYKTAEKVVNDKMVNPASIASETDLNKCKVTGTKLSR